jgi:hypothetical protein
MNTAMAIGCVTMLLSNLEGCRPCRHPCRVSLWTTFRFDNNALVDFASIFRRKRATFQVRPGSVSVKLISRAKGLPCLLHSWVINESCRYSIKSRG